MHAKTFTPEDLGHVLIEETEKGWLYRAKDGSTPLYTRAAYPDGNITITVFDSHDMGPSAGDYNAN